MIETAVRDAFGIGQNASIRELSTGLINHTYKIVDAEKSYLLQEINKQIFPNPLAMQENYLKVQRHLVDKKSFNLPEIIPAKGNNLLLENNNQVWRCFEFISNTYSPSVSSSVNEAWLVANCFGKFSAALADLIPSELNVILPGFHNLNLRFSQFETALKNANEKRIQDAKELINYIYENKYLVTFYDKIAGDSKNFHQYILHHDCKIANILFKENTNEVYCPIDLDTTQPGLYFSDLGDMIRSIVPNFSEDEVDTNKLEIRTDFYKAVKEGYMDAIQNSFTEEETKSVDMAGTLMIYMQAARFLTDYLNNDVYYKTEYEEQNKNRSANQLRLLFLLKEYIADASKKSFYV